MELPFNHKNNYINPIETDKSIDNFIIKERREQLISKKKETLSKKTFERSKKSKEL